MSSTSSLVDDNGVLSSLRKYHDLRQAASYTGNVRRPDGSNVDILTDSATAETVALCSLLPLLGYTSNNGQDVSLGTYQDHAAVLLAAHHLNTGDASLVPQLAGLPDRCPVRFAVEGIDDQGTIGDGLAVVIDHARRDPTGPEPLPCAFIGAVYSSSSIPTSTVTGVLGYPQVSHSATSSRLDDKQQFPLFGRSIPSDAGNAVPLIIYFYEVLQARHLAVINVNDAYGNAFVDGMRSAASVYAPDLIIQQIPVIDDPLSIQAAVQALQRSEIRFVFTLVYGQRTHDAIMQTAYDHNVAGNGLHNWFYGDTFGGLTGRTMVKGSPLHLAYQGVGSIQVTGGISGMPRYDAFLTKLQELKNPTDLAFMEETWPQHNDTASLGDNPSFLTTPSAYTPFIYEAAIALGLSACNALVDGDNNNDDLTLTGRAHHASLTALRFDSISGAVVFDNVTGTRDAANALYRLDNYVAGENPNNRSEVIFGSMNTNLFRDGLWESLEQYIYNDGTATIPADIAPDVEDDNLSLYVLGGGLGFLVIILGLVYMVIRESKRKAVDNAWKVKKEELHFPDTPVVLGKGSFGLVLQAEYRHTKVAVKHVLPMLMNGSSKGSSSNNMGTMSQVGTTSGMLWSSKYHSSSKSSSGDKRSSGHTVRKESQSYAKRKDELIEEMRHLSRIRHPCITSILGVVMEKDEEPMIVMEFMERGSLYDILQNRTRCLDAEVLKSIIADVVAGVRFLHAAEPAIIHGDLKARNILVDRRGGAKVADFGLSNKNHLGGTGTPYWMAPELLRRESANTAATDVYSFGIILYEIFARKDPYEGEIAAEVLHAVADKNICKRPVLPSYVPDMIKHVMIDCLQHEPSQRPSFNELGMRLERVDFHDFEKTVLYPPRYEASVSDIFPRHIAKAINEGRQTQPEQRDIVTVLLADIEGLDDISATLGPVKLQKLLKRLNDIFQELCHKHECFKIETVSNGFMAVANLAKDQSTDHASRIARLALDMVGAAHSTFMDPDNSLESHYSNVPMRVALHSGSIVADVVGNRNPRYCLWGDTLTTLGAVEKHSSSYRILCSEKTAELLSVQSPDIQAQIHGKVSIKGNDAMVCYWVSESTSSVKYALARARARQQAKLMQVAQRTAETPTSSSGSKVRFDSEAVKTIKSDEDKVDDQNDFVDLESNLKTRLGRDSSGSFVSK
mmetsp:Transcript_20453/g.38776  ORF Transcript_20453/g.38776 Transcript_20453/m.38776 type:complete len:1185 (-) Transcript_20453:69-3623(-)